MDRLVVAGRREADAVLEARALLVGVVELGERVAELLAAGDEFEPLHQAGLGAVALGERRQLDRVVRDERRLEERRLDGRAEDLVDELARAHRVVHGEAERAGGRGDVVARGDARLGRVERVAGRVADRVEERQPAEGRLEAERRKLIKIK